MAMAGVWHGMVLNRNIRILTIVLLCLGSIQSVGQEVNFEKGPENTDCHEIKNQASVGDFATEIAKRTYRFTESITISKYQPVQALRYYSCDGKTGFVISDLSGDQHQIHENVTLSAWDSLANASDIIGYYSKDFSDKFPPWTP